MRFALLLAVALIVASGDATAQQRQRTLNRPPNEAQQQQAAPDNRGTDQIPFVVKEIPRERSAEERKEADEKSELDRKLAGYTSDVDVFDKPRRTKFALHNSGMKSIPGRLPFYKDGNEAT